MTKEEAEKIVSKLTVDELLILYVLLDGLEQKRNTKQDQNKIEGKRATE